MKSVCSTRCDTLHEPSIGYIINHLVLFLHTIIALPLLHLTAFTAIMRSDLMIPPLLNSCHFTTSREKSICRISLLFLFQSTTIRILLSFQFLEPSTPRALADIILQLWLSRYSKRMSFHSVPGWVFSFVYSLYRCFSCFGSEIESDRFFFTLYFFYTSPPRRQLVSRNRAVVVSFLHAQSCTLLLKNPPRAAVVI